MKIVRVSPGHFINLENGLVKGFIGKEKNDNNLNSQNNGIGKNFFIK